MGSKKSVTIGYKYYLGMHMIVCHGPVDEIQRIDVGDRIAWAGSVTASNRIYVNNPDLFGGEKKEGGVEGYVDVMMGESTQAKNSYLVSRLGSIIPAFRGVVSFVLNQCLVSAMSPYPKPWSFLVKRIPARSWYPAKADISGSANGAHIIYETLTNTQWGMGYDYSTINDGAFRAVADQLYAEGLGLSFELTNTDSIENFVYTVVKHINGIFFTEPDTGLFSLRLLRNDYVLGSLPHYNETNITQLESFERPSFGEMINEVIVQFRPRGTDSDDSVTVQDIAAIQAQEGIISQTVNYNGIDNAQNAARIAMRDLRQKSIPLARVKVKVIRTAWNSTIGQCIKFSWVEHGVSQMVLRILGVNLGDLTNGEITLDCIEDVFGLPNATYIGAQPSGWVDPVQPPTAAAYRRLVEATYWDLARSLTQADFAYLTNTSAVLGYVIGAPAAATVNYEFWTKPAGGSYDHAADGNFAPHGTLTTLITPAQTAINISGRNGNFDNFTIGGYALIENEIVRVDSINLTTGDVVIGRGCLDTVPAAHVLGSRIYFAEGFQTADPTEYATSETVYGRALIRTGQGLLAMGSAPEDSLTMVGRFAKPYPPGNFRINTVQYPTTVTDDLVITWSHRDKTQQLATIIDHTSGNIGPEVGTTYSLEIRKVSDNSLMESSYGMTGTSFSSSLYFSSTNVRVTLWSVLSGRNSFQSQTHEFVLNNPQNLLTEAGDLFLTEAGDYLIL